MRTPVKTVNKLISEARIAMGARWRQDVWKQLALIKTEIERLVNLEKVDMGAVIVGPYFNRKIGVYFITGESAAIRQHFYPLTNEQITSHPHYAARAAVDFAKTKRPLTASNGQETQSKESP